MKTKLLLLSSTLFVVQFATSQNQTNLDQNNSNAMLNTNGVLFNDPVNGSGYEIPKNSGNHTIFASSFWFGGTDINGQIKLCAQKYASDQDFSTGPLSTFGGGQNNGIAYGDANITASEIIAYDQIWTISKDEIQNHIQNYNTLGYVIPAAILDWPAHGDATLGQDYFLAPFKDANGDGIYNPQQGDYPLIRGDKASYMILNDKGTIHSSGGEPIGLEIHMMIYQYESVDHLDNTTFINMRVINRGTQTLFDFKVGNFTDPSIGDPLDDYVGCKPDQNLIYGYNADNNDNAYGIDPPAAGILSLNNPIEVAGYIDDQQAFSSQPQTAADYWGYLNAQWGSSSVHFTEGGNGYGGVVSTNFVYPDLANWSEVTQGNTSGDRQIFCGINGNTFSPGVVRCYDFAVIFSRSGNNMDNVTGLFSIADSVQSFYDAQTYQDYCSFTPILNVKESNNESIGFFPNPASSFINIDVQGDFDVELLSLSGQLVHSEKNINQNVPIQIDLPNGLYIIKIIQNDQTFTHKLIVENK